MHRTDSEAEELTDDAQRLLQLQGVHVDEEQHTERVKVCIMVMADGPSKRLYDYFDPGQFKDVDLILITYGDLSPVFNILQRCVMRQCFT